MNPVSVIFIHGNHKKATSWNVTDFGKVINIEATIKKKNRTLLIQVDDFTVSPSKLVRSFVESMKDQQWIIVCHSLGIVYCYEFVKHLKIVGICFIDCTPLDETFLKKLSCNIDNTCDELNSVAPSSSSRDELLYDYIKNIRWDLSPKIICHVHINYQSDEKFDRKVKYFSSITRKNDKSKMMIHPGKGHMIHYNDSAKIIDSITQLIKY